MNPEQQLRWHSETLRTKKELVQSTPKETTDDLAKQRNKHIATEAKLKSEIELLKQEVSRYEEHTKNAFQRVESLTLELGKLQDEITTSKKTTNEN